MGRYRNLYRVNNLICFECDSTVDIHQHHIIPKSMGGTRTIPLCCKCHGKIHDRNFLKHKFLQKRGIEYAKNLGIKFGRPKAISEKDLIDITASIIFEKIPTSQLAKDYNVSEPTMRRCIRKIKLDLNLL